MINFKSLRFPLLLFAMAAGTFLFAQEKTYEDVISVTLRNSDAITNAEGEVTGYYFFYQNSRARRGTAEYRLELLDVNLDKVGTKTFSGSSSLRLTDAVYNGELIGLRLVDHKEETVSVKLYDSAGERIAGRTIDYSIYDAAELQSGTSTPHLFAVPGQGFVHYTTLPRKGRMSQTNFNIKFISNDRENRGWTKTSASSSEDFEAANFVAVENGIIFSALASRPKMMSRDLEYALMAHDVETGDKLFEKEMGDTRYNVMVNSMFSNGDQIQILGEYYDKDDKMMKSQSLGLASITMSREGEITDRKYLGWGSEVQSFLPASLHGKIEDVGYLFFHEFVEGADGKVYAVAESYRRAASGAGIAAAALSGGRASVTKLVIEDFYIFTFDQNFDLAAVDVFEKSKTNMELPAGSSYLSTQLLSLLAKAYDAFDFSFIQRDDDIFTIGYRDIVKVKGEPRRSIYGAITQLDGEFTKDEISLEDSDADATRILNAQAGYVLLLEYFRKDKKMNLRLEKVNN